MRSDAHLDSDWNMSPGRLPPRHPASGGSSNVSSSRIMSPVLSPYHTLSPPPLCSQFPIIHLTMRRWRQGDISQDILHHQYSLNRKANALTESSPYPSPVDECCLSVAASQLHSLNWRVGLSCSSLQSEQLWMGMGRDRGGRSNPNWWGTESQPPVSSDAQCPSCGAKLHWVWLTPTWPENIMTFWFQYWNFGRWTLSELFPFIFWSCVTTEAPVTEPSHLDTNSDTPLHRLLSPLLSAHCKLPLFYFNQLDSTS